LEPILEYIEQMDEETMDSWIAFGKWVAILAVATKTLSGFLGVVEGLGTLRALTTGLQGVSGELVGVTGKANAAGKAMSGFKILGVASAAAVGLAIGKMLNDVFFAPARARKERTMKGAEEEAYQARTNVSRLGTLEEQEAALARLKKKREDLPPLSPMERGTIYKLFGESPKERRDRVIEEMLESEQKLSGSIAQGTTEREFELERDFGIQAEISRPADFSGGQSIQSTNNITINAQGTSAEEVVRLTKREIKTAERRTLKELKTSQRSIAPAEQ
jgi:hypothetical protein